MFKSIRMVLLACLLLTVVSAASAQEADLQAVKEYAIAQAADMHVASQAFLETAQAYYDLIASHDFDYEAAWAADAETLSAQVLALREGWLGTSLPYELNEGIVAGVPSLSHFDVLIDAGPSAEEAPDEALDWTLTLPDGTELVSPGNLFHTLGEPALYGTNPARVALDADLDGDGEVEFTEALPDANFVLGVVQRLDEETANLVTAIDEWEPTLEDTFTALVVMIPTMSEYFGQWKESAFVAGDEASEAAFVATSRLFDIKSILNGLDVAYTNVSSLVNTADADLDTQIDTGLDDLITYVNNLYDEEASGTVFDPEEVDLLGTEAQDKAEALAALVAQAADTLDVPLALE